MVSEWSTLTESLRPLTMRTAHSGAHSGMWNLLLANRPSHTAAAASLVESVATAPEQHQINKPHAAVAQYAGMHLDSRAGWVQLYRVRNKLGTLPEYRHTIVVQLSRCWARSSQPDQSPCCLERRVTDQVSHPPALCKACCASHHSLSHQINADPPLRAIASHPPLRAALTSQCARAPAFSSAMQRHAELNLGQKATPVSCTSALNDCLHPVSTLLLLAAATHCVTL